MAQRLRIYLPIQRHRFDPWVGRSSGGGNGNPLSTTAWEIPLKEQPSGLQSMGLQRVRYDLVTKQQQNNLLTDLRQFLRLRQDSITMPGVSYVVHQRMCSLGCACPAWLPCCSGCAFSWFQLSFWDQAPGKT